jgi:hypothetical protein
LDKAKEKPMSNWYYTTNGQQQGPVSGEVLKQLATAGRISPTDLVWREGMPQWIAASTTTLFTPPVGPSPQVCLSVAPPPPPPYGPGGYAAPVSAVPLSYQSPLAQQYESLPATPVVWIGILLLVGFIFPIMGPGGRGRSTEIFFPNITYLVERGVPLEGKLFFVHPLLAGIAALIVSGIRSVARPVTLLVVAALAVVPIALSPEALRGITRSLSQMQVNAISVVVGGLALLGMIVGPWVTIRRPQHMAGPVIGAIGAGLFLLSLFLPVQDPLTGKSTLSVAASFRTLTAELDEDMGFLRAVAIVGILQMVVMIIAAIMCFVVVANRHKAGSIALGALRLVVVAFCVIVLALLVAMVGAAGNAPSGVSVAPTIITTAIKMVSWFGALFFILPVGLTDLLLCVIPKSEQQVLSGPPTAAYRY